MILTTVQENVKIQGSGVQHVNLLIYLLLCFKNKLLFTLKLALHEFNVQGVPFKNYIMQT